MVRNVALCVFACALTASGATAFAGQRAPAPGDGALDSLVSRYAAQYNVPEDLIRRVIKRESRGNARVVSHGNYGLMQIKPATARSLGYSGGAAGLLDAETNMNYAVKYLAGAYKVAGGNPNLAVHYYAAGYYYAAKGKGMAGLTRGATAMASANEAPLAYHSDTNPY